ncbi:Hypothetical predicted protein [Mytilus galloprovincialis]|uniref:Dynamin N-terminal domain-containing protein n=1 Tax=Mytilus galloprovincialis TaxID=29158 RepID=A0A8B6EVD3_MYTGA|nr:Hypothetical predicted protein [Mytilus galloprovincialis]
MSEQSSANQGQSVVTKILDFDLQRKHKLVEIYDDILQLADELQREKSIIQELTTQFGNFRSEIPNSKEILLEEECPIIIAGETSAGKSGFINLLIGSDIFPVSALACTSTIIKLHNSTKREIRVTDDKGKEKVIEFGPDNESSSIQKEVRKYVTIKGEFLNCKCVDMYFPVPMLKGNTVIVDTPGIGTTANPELNARLFEFLPRAVAFIYIIDSSRAGGLENDRLLAIFEELRSWRQRGKLIEFDASRTIFVCNKWDAVEEEEDEVLNYITETLREHWPNFHEKQLFKLSVKEEKKLAKQEKSSENYRKLLSGIKKMVPSSLEAKVVMNARYL